MPGPRLVASLVIRSGRTIHGRFPQTALAWELAATARPHLSRVDADRIFIPLGIGETFAAIDALITVIAQNQIPLSEDQVAVTVAWLNRYLGQGAEPRLRHLLTSVMTVAFQQVPAAHEA